MDRRAEILKTNFTPTERYIIHDYFTQELDLLIDPAGGQIYMHPEAWRLLPDLLSKLDKLMRNEQ